MERGIPRVPKSVSVPETLHSSHSETDSDQNSVIEPVNSVQGVRQQPRWASISDVSYGRPDSTRSTSSRIYLRETARDSLRDISEHKSTDRCNSNPIGQFIVTDTATYHEKTDEQGSDLSPRRRERTASKAELEEIRAAHARMAAVITQLKQKKKRVDQKLETTGQPSGANDMGRVWKRVRPHRVVRALRSLRILPKSVGTSFTVAEVGVQTAAYTTEDEGRQIQTQLETCRENCLQKEHDILQLQQQWWTVSRELEAARGLSQAQTQRTDGLLQRAEVREAEYRATITQQSRQLAELQEALNIAHQEKDWLQQDLQEVEKRARRLEKEIIDVGSSEEAAINKMSFLQDDSDYLKKCLSETEEEARDAKRSNKKMKEEIDAAKKSMVEMKINATEVLGEYVDKLHSYQEEKKDLLQVKAKSSKMIRRVFDMFEKQYAIEEERNILAQEVSLLDTKSTAQDLHISRLEDNISSLTNKVQKLEEALAAAEEAQSGEEQRLPKAAFSKYYNKAAKTATSSTRAAPEEGLGEAYSRFRECDEDFCLSDTIFKNILELRRLGRMKSDTTHMKQKTPLRELSAPHISTGPGISPTKTLTSPRGSPRKPTEGSDGPVTSPGLIGDHTSKVEDSGNASLQHKMKSDVVTKNVGLGDDLVADGNKVEDTKENGGHCTNTVKARLITA